MQNQKSRGRRPSAEESAKRRYCRWCTHPAEPAHKYCVKCSARLADTSYSVDRERRSALAILREAIRRGYAATPRTAGHGSLAWDTIAEAIKAAERAGFRPDDWVGLSDLVQKRFVRRRRRLAVAAAWKGLRRKMPEKELNRRLGGLERWQWARLFAEFVAPWLERLDEVIAKGGRKPRFAFLIRGVSEDDGSRRLVFAFDDAVRIRVKFDGLPVSDLHGLAKGIAGGGKLKRITEVTPLVPCEAWWLFIFRPVAGGISSVAEIGDGLRLFAWDVRAAVAKPSQKRLRQLRNVYLRARKDGRSAWRLGRLAERGYDYADQIDLMRSAVTRSIARTDIRRFPLHSIFQCGYELTGDARTGRHQSFPELTAADEILRGEVRRFGLDLGEGFEYALAGEEPPGPEAERTEVEIEARLNAQLAGLTEAERLAVRRSLRWEREGLSQAEGCRRDGVNYRAHRKAEQRGRQKLGASRKRGGPPRCT